jgi:hypothetical protein
MREALVSIPSESTFLFRICYLRHLIEVLRVAWQFVLLHFAPHNQLPRGSMSSGPAAPRNNNAGQGGLAVRADACTRRP